MRYQMRAPGTVSILLNNGSGIFVQSATVSVGNTPVSIAVGDFNGDGSLDLALGNETSNTVSILLNRSRSASISLLSNSISFGSVTGSKGVYLKITNNGTDSSLVISNITSSNSVFTFNRTSLTIPANGTDSVLVTFTQTRIISYSDSLTISSNDPFHPTTKAYLTGSGYAIGSVTPAVNALKVVPTAAMTVTFNTGMNSSTFTSSTIKINGSLSGLHTATYSYSSSTQTVTITPATPFKYGEVVTTTLTRGIKSTAGDSLASAYNWSFTIKSSGGSGKFTQSSTLGVGSYPSSVTAGDFNGDGYMDLAVANSSSNTVSILLNNGNGTFTQSSTPGVGSNPYSITAGDFNGDGYLDLAVANINSNTVSILLNNGNGTFTQSSTPSVGSDPYSVTAGDFNGDGYLDLAVANYYSNTVSILLNNGNGTFTQSSTISVGSNPNSVTAGDFNGDGYIDLAVANYYSNTVSILLNNGNGTFTQSSTISVGSNPNSVTAGDFNGDGYIDLAVANYYSNTVSILLNNGNGTFTQSSTPGVGSYPYSVTAGDFNGDGYLDLAVANSSSNTVSILLNNGNGTFTQSSTPGVGSNPYAVTVGDFNGDGYMDLAVANYYSNTVSILLNRSHSASIALSTNSIAFGAVGSGNSSGIYLKFSNNGTDSSLVISNLTSSNSMVSVNRTSLSIAAGAMDSVLVTFSPTSPVSVNDSLKIYSNDPKNPVSTVYLTGISGNYISGVIASNTTWTKASLPYIINGTSAVGPGVTLTIQNGVQVIFNGFYIFNVDGTLLANGLPGDSVVITGITSGIVYPGLTIRSGGTGTFAFTKIQNAYSGITTQSGSTVSIKNSRFTGNITGFKDTTTTVTETLKTSKFDNNGTGIITSNSAILTVDSSAFLLNSTGFVCNNYATATVTNSCFSANSIALGDNNQSGGNFTINNCDILSNTNSGIYVQYSNLTVTNSRITGNGSYGIYAPYGSNLTVTNSRIIANPSYGIYSGLYSYYGNGTIANSTIKSNGIGIWSNASSLTITADTIISNTGIGIWSNTGNNISYNKITNNGSHGLFLSSTPSLTYNDILNNAGDGVQASNKPTLSFNRLYGNTGYNFNATLQAADSIIARNNYWGAATDTAVSAKIHDYYDDGVTIRVLYKPYFTKSIFPPQNLAVSSSVGQMKLSWSKSNPPTNFMRYRIYGGLSTAPTAKMDSTSNPGDSTRTLTGMTPGTKYYFRMTAVDSTGLESDYSNEVNCIQLPLVQIYSVTPVPNQNIVAANTTITVKFAFDVNTATLSNVTLIVNASLSGPHISTFNYNSSTKTATITPNIAFKPGDIVTVTLKRGIKSTTGDSLLSPFLWSFTIQASIGAAGKFTQSSTPSVGSSPYSVTSGDFNGDGLLDIAVANYSSSTVSILLNNGNGTFTQSSTPISQGSPWSVIAGDFNGDGYIDLAVTNYYSNTVSILLNNGNRTFTQNSTIGVGSYPSSITTGDFNGDGYIDLAVANNGSNTVSILLNNGNGTFTQSSTPGVGSNPESIMAGDFNGDGYLDLAVANTGSNTVSILLNNGNGTFTQSSAPGVGSNSQSVTAGDFNGDGYLDLAVANYSSNTVSILLNNGNGTFTQSSTPGVGSNPYSVTAGDFNGDGYLDLAVANSSSNTVSILLNNGNGTFTQSSTPGVGGYPYSVTAGDFNGDGSLDLAVANINSGNVSILINHPSKARMLLSSASIGFGSLATNASMSSYLKFTNIAGDSSLVINNLSVVNPVFTLNKTSLTIPPLGIDSVLITFKPTAVTNYSDSLSMTTNDPSKPVFKVGLSGTGAVIHPAPVQVTPANLSINQSINQRFIWHPSVSAATYRLQVGMDSTFVTNVVLNDTTITDTTRIDSVLTYSTKYYWHVNAKNFLGTGSYSSVWIFTTAMAPPAMPILVSPSNNVTNQTLSLTLKWNKSITAATYRVQVSMDSTFATNIVLDDSTVTDTTRAVAGLYNSVTYYWRVRAQNIGGSIGYTSFWRFTTILALPPVPMLAFPPNTATNQPVPLTLRWNKSIGASSYRVQLGTDSTFTSNLFLNDSTVTDTTRTINGLNGNMTYYWRVDSKNIAGIGIYSTIWNFRTKTLPPAPQNLTTAAGSGQVLLKWNKIAGNNFLMYRVYMGTDSTLVILKDSSSASIMDTTKIITGLIKGTKYYFRVSVLDTSRLESALSIAVSATPTIPAISSFTPASVRLARW